jgi:2-phosphosulfolactate phosphatase
MLVSVALTPLIIPSVERSVCIVLDVLRASSTMLALFEAGASALYLSATPEEAAETAASDRAAHCLCGERDGLRPEGFDFGNSPSELSEASLDGRRVVYVTSNGTNALRAVAGAPLVLVGTPRNEVAVVRQALREARERSLDLLIVCAGDDGGRSVSLEDAFVAGMLVERLIKLHARHVAAEEADGDAEALSLDESAILVHRTFGSYLRSADAHATAETLLTVFGESRNGRDLPRKGYAQDLEYCAQVDVSAVVPHLATRDGVLAVVAGA